MLLLPTSSVKPTSANAGVDIHIHANGSASRNCKGLRFRPEVTFRLASLHIQNVIARRQRNAVISVLIGGKSGNFFLAGLAQNDERIFRIVFSRAPRRACFGKLNLLQ